MFFNPKTELVGVFITAWAVFICYAMAQQPDLNGVLLFLSTLGYYSIDHFFDLRRMKQANFAFYTKAYFAMIVFAVASFMCLSLFYGFTGTALDFMHRFWPTISLGGIYWALHFLGNNRFTALLKWFLIAVSVGLAMDFPASFQESMLTVLVCLSNVMAFSYLERHKDKMLDNVNLFNTMFKREGLLILLLLVFFVGIMMALLYNMPRGWGVAGYGLMVLLISVWETKFMQNTYRWWLDALLPLAFLPFG